MYDDPKRRTEQSRASRWWQGIRYLTRLVLLVAALVGVSLLREWEHDRLLDPPPPHRGPDIVAEANLICGKAEDRLPSPSAAVFRQVSDEIRVLVASARVSGGWSAVVAGLAARADYVEALDSGTVDPQRGDPRQAVEDAGTAAQIRLGVDCATFA